MNDAIATDLSALIPTLIVTYGVALGTVALSTGRQLYRTRGQTRSRDDAAVHPAGVIEMGRRQRPVHVGVMILPVVDGRTRVSHLIDVDVAAASRRSGCYTALCDAKVVAASLTTAPIQDCNECRAHTPSRTDDLPRERYLRRRFLAWRRSARAASSGARSKFLWRNG